MTQDALAVFVRPVEASSANSLLIEEIGADQALEIYKLCIESLRQTLEAIRGVKTYWAVEKEEMLDDALWNDRSRLWPGDKDLGEAQYNIYQTLRGAHQNVAIMSVDCPQISTYMLHNCFTMLRDYEYVVGPANRGNYYLFAGNQDMPLKSWAKVQSYRNYKMQYLINNLPSPPFMFGEFVEIHTKKNLLEVIRQMPSIPHAGQKALVKYIQNLLNEG